MTRNRQSWPWWRWALTGLSALALGLSSFLGWHIITGGSMTGCGGGSPCDDVLSSRWSAIGGVLPVSGLAAGVYLALLAACLFIGPAVEAPIRRLAWEAMLVLVGAVAGSAVWFFIVQKWFVRAFCPYCLATHGIGLVLATLVLWRAQAQRENDASPRRMIGGLRAGGMALAGVLLAALLAVGQLSFSPAAVYRGGESQHHLPALDPHAAPLIGSPDAPHVVTLLFDYNCPHCQELHLLLDEVVRRYRGNLAIALCPTPLNTNCNPYIPRNAAEFQDSCELAKIGLAVWTANRQAFPAFDRWMFSFEAGDHWRPRSLAAAKSKAVELVGQDKLDAALANPWISQYLQASVQIYSETLQGGNNAVPKLVFGSRWVIPQPSDAGDLVAVLHNSLGLPQPR